MADKDVTFYITDISGSPITGIPLVNLSVFLDAYSCNTSASVITISEDTSGYYNVNVNPLPSCESHISLKYTGVNQYFVSPDWHDLEKNYSYTIDDVYSTIYTQSISPVPWDASVRFTEQEINIKEADDFSEVISVPARYVPLTGWTNFTAQCYPEEKLLVASTPAITGGTYGVSVLSATKVTLQVDISKEIFTNKVPDGVSSKPIYCDIQAHTPAGKRKTLVQIKFIVKREFNSNS